MEIRKDQHQEMFSPSLRDDYKNDDDDEEDNRFIISLDDVEMKDDSLDECEKSSEEPEEKAGNSQVLSDASSLHCQSHTFSLCATTDGIQFEDKILKAKPHSGAGKVHQTNFSVIDCNRDDTSCSPGGCHLSSWSKSRENDKAELSHLNSENGTVEQSNDMKLVERKDELGNAIVQHSVAMYSQARQALDRPNSSSISETLCTETVSKPERQFTKFAPHKDCSCIMCYQGRGIIDSNWIPTGAKRKVEASSTYHYPAKTMRATSSNIPGNPDIFLSSQITVNSNRPVAESLVSRSHMSKDVSLSNTSNLALMRASTMSSNFVLIVPHTSSVSSEKKNNAQGTTQEQHQMYSSSPRVTSSTPLPVLTPKPHVHSSMSNPISASLSSSSPIVSNLSSNLNFSLTSQTSSVNTVPKTQVSTSQSDKTHVVLIDKMSAEKQLAGLSDILKRASKVDLSESGVVRVHFKPVSSQEPLSQCSQKSPVSTSQVSPHVSQSKSTPHAPEHCIENTLIGLVKRHLVNQSSSTMKETPLGQNVTRPNILKKSTQSCPRKPSLHPKPSLSYSLISKSFIPGKVASVGSSGPLPPPPPLIPRPGAFFCTESRPTKYQAVEVVDLEEEQTETMVLPLPKHNQQKLCGEESSLNLSKQDERLLSPSLFTFSSPLELSPQKSTSQYSSSFKNQMHRDSPSASSISSSSLSILVTESSPIISSAPSSTPVTTMSFAVSRQNAIHCTSAWSDSPQIVSQASYNSNVSPRQENHITSEWHQPSSSKLLQSRTSDLFKPSAHSSTISTLPQSSVSIVSNATGLKMKIRLKDSKPECTNTSSKEQQSNIEQSKISNDAAEVRQNDSVIAGGLSSSQGQSAVAVDNTRETTACSNESSLARPPTLSSRIETAEEMFKRFQDQAMREVYNAQFGVGEIQRSLRPVRTPFANGDDPFSHSKSIDESKNTKGDADKAKPNQSDSNQAGNTCDTGKKVVKNKRKRTLSDEARQRIPIPSEKILKLDINQFPKLMQDNSIVNRKTIFTPNILAGHKVYVKFNVFSNSQSGRSFLVPFFNIGGSRTQFDVEDVEYFNKAVVEFEKEERSCARHLLYYSREGQKATFLRKENALHSNELSAKSYKKNSYILQGYSREKSKKPAPPTDEWKLDRIVAIEIDRAEQDCEIELSHAHKPAGIDIDHAERECKVMSSSDSGDVLDKIVRKHSPKLNDNSPPPVTSFPLKDLSTRAHLTNFPPASLSGFNSFQFVNHREKVNILKRNMKVRKSRVNSICSPPFAAKSSSEPKSSHINQLQELIAKGNVEETVSLTTSHMRHQTPVCNEQISVSKELTADEGSKHMTDIPRIKTEVPDDGYDSALMVKENREPPPSLEILGISIKSEPIDDYTESLAQSMNVSLQGNKQIRLNSLESSYSQDHGEYSQHRSDNYPTHEMHASNSSKIVSSKDDCLTTANIRTEHNITPSDITGPLSPTVAVIKSVSPETDVDTSSKVCAEAHPPCGIESKTRKSPELESLSVSESNEVTSPSEVETSSNDEETDEGALSPPILNNGCANVPPANTKITSLVESLKQRLVEGNSSFPSLFPSDQQRIKKRKKKKKKITCMTGPNSIKNSLHSTSAPVTESHNLSPHSSKITSGSDVTSEFGNVTCNSEIDIKADFASSMQLSTSSLLSTSPKLSLTNSPVPSSQLDVMVDKPRLPKSRTKMDDVTTKDSRSERPASLSLSCTNVKNVGETVSQSSKVLLKETLKFHDNEVEESDGQDVTKPELHEVSGFDGEIHQLTKVLDGTKWTERKGRGIDKLLFSSKSEKEGINKHSENTQDSTICKQTEEAENALDQGVNSNCSTPCSEIDVGTEEFAFEISKKIPTTKLGSLLTSPPVPTTGQISIKDFTREHDLMVPFEPKPHLQNGSQRNVECKRSITARSSFNKKEGNGNKIATSYPTVAKILKEDSHQADFKPSIASLLCNKLAIDTDPVTPTPIVKAVPLSATATSPRTKLITSQEQSTSYPVSSSFYKPTLSAIFGVENVSLPPSVDAKQLEGKDKESPSAATQGKRRRQVALKGVHNRKKTVGKLVPQHVKPKTRPEQNTQDQKGKMNISLKTKIQLRDHLKAAGPKVTSHRQTVSLQSVFRTWRQLSHEEKSKQQEICYPYNISTIPCKVVLQRLQLDSNGQLITSKLDDAKEGAGESIQDKDKKSVIARKKRKRSAAKGQRRRNPREKKDIVDYYASMLENLRKKAQMLEEEAMKKQQDKLENEEPEIEIKVEPIAFEEESSSLISQTEHDNVIKNAAIRKDPFISQCSLEDAKFCSKDIQNDGAKMKMSPTEENGTELMEMHKNLGSLELGSHNTDRSNPSNLLPVHTELELTHVNKISENKCEKDNAFPDQAVTPSQNAVSSEMIVDVSNKADDVLSDQMATAVPNALSESIERDDDHGLSDTDRVKNSSQQTEISKAGDNKRDDDHSGQDSDSILKASNDQRDKDNEDFFPPEKSEIQTESKSVNSDERTSNATVHDNVNNESVSDSQSHSTTPPTSGISKRAVHSSVDSSYLSDSSEGGGLVIDYDSEQDLNKSSDGPPGEVKEESSKSQQRSHDVTDLISDSSFMTKDIVLGFENELGADTVFSTLSHGDMEDLFLLEDGDEDSEIGMIPDEEVEKLLGLDMAGEGEFGNSGSKQQKTDLFKTSSSSTTSEKSDSTAIQWVSLSEKNREETKEKIQVDLNENRKSTCSEEPINNQNGRSETVKSLKDNFSNTMSKSERENYSQIQEKKNQISPSWNRLLGSEALNKMKNDVPVSSSHLPSSQHDKSSQSQSAGQRKLKFCAGALSKALKLSAEMKKVFADGPSQNNSAQKGITISKDTKLIKKIQSKQCPRALTETSTSAVKTETREEHFPNGNEKHSEDSLQTARYSSTEKLRNSIQETLHFDLKQSNSNMPVVLPNIKHKAESGKDNVNDNLEEIYNANADHMGNNHITVTDRSNPAVQRDTRSRYKCNSGATDTNRNNLNKGPEMSHLDSFHLSNTLQSSSEVPSAEENTKVLESKSKSTVLTTGAKGIDINKLKLKLNPLLFGNKKILSTVSKVKFGDIPAPSPITGKEVTLQSRALNIEMREQGAIDSPEPGLELDADQWSAEQTPKRKNENIVETQSHLDKQKIDSEPVLNTAKLCNILKNLKKPPSGFKVSKTTDSFSSSGLSVHGKKSSTDQNHSTAKSGRKLRSSPRSGHSEKSEKDMETVDSPELHMKALQREDQSVVGKAEDEDRVGRSFIDCLSDVISGAWENA